MLSLAIVLYYRLRYRFNQMGRESYDDMVSSSNERRKRGTSSSKTGLIAVLGVLICAIAVLVFLILSPVEEENSVSQTQTPVTVEVKQPEIILPSSASSADAVLPAEENESAAQETAPSSPAQTVTAESIQASSPSSSNSRRNTAVDLISAQDMANFDTADHVIYLTHTVKEGEDLQTIAEAYGRNVNTLISVNRIMNIAAIQPGVQLRIPNMDGQLYTVQQGDMLSTIAYKFNPELGWRNLMDINSLSSENIYVGQELFIPSMADAGTAAVLQDSSLTFISPVSGSISASYGEVYSGNMLSGILITCSEGSHVMCAADGAVVDLGTDDNYGKFVIIQHDQGYKTTYAFLDSVSVTIGNEVKQGDAIGKVSASTTFTSPTIYFQIDQSGIALDPSLFI